MTKEEIQKLVNKGSVTQTGLLDSEKILKEDKEAFAAHHINHPDVAEQFINADENETPEVPPVVDPEPVEPTPEEIAEQFAADIKAGGDVVLGGDVEITAKYAVAKPSNIDFGGHTVTNTTPNGDAFQLGGGDFSFKNGTIDNRIGGGSSAGIYANSSKGNNIVLEDMNIVAAYPVYLNNATGNPVCTIKSGNYTSPFDKGVAVYVEKGGKAIIEGGTFGTEGHPSDFVLNILDATRKDKEVRDFILVKGGTFINFDPSNNAAEGPGTNFVADGYKVVVEEKGEDKYYTVVKDDSISVDPAE